MSKELYLYSGIYSYTAQDFMRQFDENKSQDIVIRVNTDGGDPQAMYGMASKMKEHPKDVTARVDGKAYSAGSFILPFAKKVIALSVSSFILHRAAYSDFYEKNYMTADESSELARINADLRKALEMKVDANVFARVAGYTFDQMFDPSSRIDIYLSAQQAKEVGLVDEIIDINSNKIAADVNKFLFFDGKENKPTPTTQSKTEDKKTTTMTVEELKSKHPEIFAQIQNAAIAAERDRVGVWLAYADADLKAVVDGIKKGDSMTQTMQAELNRKAYSAEALKGLEDETKKDVKTAEVEKPKEGKDKEVDNFLAEVKSQVNIKN